jgi:hypothetical protein
LPASLKDLTIAFAASVNKGIFPHLFMNNEDLDLNYKGSLPNYDDFYQDKVTLEEYQD